MILDRIVADTLLELEARKRSFPQEDVERLAFDRAPACDFASALRGDGVRLIAEVKKSSPSRGVIRADFDPVQIARTYVANGVAAISVLTEPRHFQGSLDYLEDIGNALGDERPPLLRKDFITDPYQVFESRAHGADAILLIVAILRPQQLGRLLQLSWELGMSCLVEVHDEAELETALASGALIIGVNNRDLRTFNVDLATFERLRPRIPNGHVVVAESGIRGRKDVERLRAAGVDAVLVGEALMTAPDVGAKLRELRCAA